MKNVFVFILMLGLFSSFTLESSARDNKMVLGEWSFSVPDGGQGYQDGTLTFSEKESAMNGAVTFTSGYKINLEEVKFEENKLSFKLYIDYEPIAVTMTLVDGKFKGIVEVGGYELPITAERKK